MAVSPEVVSEKDKILEKEHKGIFMTKNICQLEWKDRAEWSELASSFRDYNYRHLWDFGIAAARRRNAQSEHVAIRCGKEVIGIADVRVKTIPFLGTGIAYINGGPLTLKKGGAENPIELRSVLDALVQEYTKKRGLTLRIHPPLGNPEWNIVQEEVCLQAGFVFASRLRPYRTMLLNLQKPLVEIRKDFKQKWRNLLNKAEKTECEVLEGKDPALTEQFLRLYDVMLQRKKFDTDPPATFYHDVQCRLEESERFHTCIAFYQGKPVSGHVSSMLGDVCVYLLGASIDEGLQKNASYLLQWHAIQAAIQKGCIWYDLGGIDPEKNPGVYHFKQGLGGMDIMSPGPFECTASRWKNHLVSIGEKMYKALKK
jgi:lipid II:glycine glycyltransferase (peptidoglycan interpeptide bridge formation enzyme)